MPLPYAIYRLVLHGQMGASPSTWSIGLAVVNHGAASAGAMQAWLAGIASDVETSYVNSSAGWGAMASPDTVFQGMRAYHYAAAASSADLTAEFTFTNAAQGGGSKESPTMQACCVSLLTGAAGRHNRGRVYVPADGEALAVHQFSSGHVPIVGRGIRDLIDHINGSTLAGEDCTVVIASQQAVPPPVTRIRVDSLPDTQRVRANGQVASTVFSDDV